MHVVVRALRSHYSYTNLGGFVTCGKTHGECSRDRERESLKGFKEECSLTLQEFGTIMSLRAGNGCLYMIANSIFLKLISGIPCNLGL